MAACGVSPCPSKIFLSIFFDQIYAHLGEFGCVTAGNLLRAQLDELALQFVELLSEVLLVLRPELGGLNFACRLWEELVGALIWLSICFSPLWKSAVGLVVVV